MKFRNHLKSYNVYELTSCDVAEVTATAPECITEDSTRMEVSSPATPCSADDLSNSALSDKPSNVMAPIRGKLSS